MEREWLPDRLLPGYECLIIDLSDELTVPGEPSGSLRASLIRRNAPRSHRAVLYLHGWNDYFFQTHLADFFAAQGIDFYAIELRRYGRNLVSGQPAGYIADIADYYTELDAAVEVIKTEHESVSLLAHSTGGLIGALWADSRPGTLDAVMFNSPWLELHASSWIRQVTKPLFGALKNANPLFALPITDNGFFHRAMHISQEGEWDYDFNLKGDPAFRVRVGWMHAILAGHSRVAAGLDIDAPTLVMTAKRSDLRNTWHEDLKRADIVLDVDQIASRVTSLGDNVTLVRIPDGTHELFLSPRPVRDTVFAELERWMAAYLPSEPSD